MLTRRGVVLAIIAFGLLSGPPVFAEAKQKKRKDRSGPVGAQDGKDDVKGATWQINADLVGGKKKEQFKFRVQDGVIFDLQGKRAGVVSALGETKEGGKKSKMVLRETFPLKGEIIITQAKLGVWNGVLKTKEGEEWTCRFEVLDR
jgi:hypothetical protein